MEGALGLGTSLIYAPGNFADTGEIVALVSAAAEYGGSYISHIRSESNELWRRQISFTFAPASFRNDTIWLP